MHGLDLKEVSCIIAIEVRLLLLLVMIHVCISIVYTWVHHIVSFALNFKTYVSINNTEATISKMLRHQISGQQKHP